MLRVVALGLLACAMPVAALAQGAPAPHCAVQVEFASVAMGIDRGAFEKVRTLLARDRAVLGVEHQRWGREGETNLCVQLRKAEESPRVFRRIKALLPARPRGPITVTTRSGLRFAASAR